MWKFNEFLICFFAFNGFAAAAVKEQNNCTIKLPGDVTGFAPVILISSPDGAYQLFKPTGKVTKLNNGTKLLLACTGNKNVFENTTFSTTLKTLKCLEGNFVDLNNNEQSLRELVCKSIPSSYMKITNEICLHGNGRIYKIGFIVKNKFYGPVFEICYSNVKRNIFYTHNVLNGAAIEYSIAERSRRSFSADGTQFSTSKMNIFYTKSNQIERFESYFGANQSFVDKKNFLARGHLTADADFIFGYQQLATYYYANVAPAFQVINAGNWLRVEKLARAVSASYQDDIEVYNSYMGILALPRKDGALIEIHLDDTKQIEVPKYFYKVLVHKASDSAIVFLTVNNPYIDGQAEEICTNVCKESGLRHANFPDVTKGYTFCCELNEFKLLVVDSLPEEVQASYLLKLTI